MKSQAPEFWNNPKKAESLLKNIQALKKWTESYEEVHGGIEDLLVLVDFHKEGEASEAEVEEQYQFCKKNIEALETRNMLNTLICF